jgi:hypothetical protein
MSARYKTLDGSLTEELKEIVLGVGRRRIGGLMRRTGMYVDGTHKYEVKTYSNSAVVVA